MRQWQCVYSKLRIHVQYSRRLAAHHIASHKCRILHNANVLYIKSCASSDRQSSIVYWILGEVASTSRTPEHREIDYPISRSLGPPAELELASRKLEAQQQSLNFTMRTIALAVAVLVLLAAVAVDRSQSRMLQRRGELLLLFSVLSIYRTKSPQYIRVCCTSSYENCVLQDRQTSNLIVRWIACNKSTEKFAQTLMYQN